MTPKQIRIVKQSWSILQKIDPVIVADVFYTKLFHDKPPLRKMFPEKMEDQYKKLIDMISVIIGRLDRLDELTQDIEDMAKRHTGYGVKDQHYTLVGNALLWTLAKGLGNDWTDEMKDAWIECYTTLTNIMVRSAKKNQT